MNIKSKVVFILILVTVFCMQGFFVAGASTSHETGTEPALGLTPDQGFPVWLTPDPVNYYPLVTSQTSGLDWIGTDRTDDGFERDWFIIVDDVGEGGIHVINVTLRDTVPVIEFLPDDLTLPPPQITGINADPVNGYDWEAIALHPWSGNVFMSHEGSKDEIGIYCGIQTPGDDVDFSCVKGEIRSVPQHISGMLKFELPGWDEVFGGEIDGNLGIEGLACSGGRLFAGLESPYSFMERLGREKSTVLGIWKIDPEEPSDTKGCELVRYHDTEDWESRLGYKIETICGLDAMDDNRVIGIDRDNGVLFAVSFDNEGECTSGRIFYLDIPGPSPLDSDECDEIKGPPKLVKPSLESVAVVPITREYDYYTEIEYRIYLTADPWGPGWSLLNPEIECESYEERLARLLPALYCYTVEAETLFPG